MVCSTKNAAYLVLAYGLLTALGGAMGYFKAGSVISLVMGLVFGAVLIGSAIAIFRGVRGGKPVALIATILLTVLFGYRFALTLAFFPAGLMALLGVGLLIVCFTKRLR